MPSSDGWYLAGPLIAFALVGMLAWVLRPRLGQDLGALGESYAGGLDLFREPEDYGLLSPAAIADDWELADDVCRLLGTAGIRSTVAGRPDGRITVLVFAEEADKARRLVGGSPDRQ